MGLFDTHAHLDDPRFDEDREQLIDDLKNKGIEYVLNVGADLKSSYASIDLADQYDFIYAAVGIHPHDVKLFDDSHIEELKEMAKHQKVLAIGEIGLDYYYEYSPKQMQQEFFAKQIKLADEINLPYVIHSRDAVQDTYDIIKKVNASVPFVLHSYNQSVEMTKKYMELGGYFSISGPVTFKNAKALKEVVSHIPMDRIFIETDSPYLTPEPFRGKRNDPSLTIYVASEIARLKNLETEDVINITKNNAKKFFNII